MKHFYVITNQTKDKDYKITYYIKDYLEQRGTSCLLKAEFDVKNHIEQTAMMEQIDCVLVLGGDGTLLQAAVDLAEYAVPFLGINLGTYGFLAEVEKTGIDDALNRLLVDDFEIEERMMIYGEIEKKIENDATKQSNVLKSDHTRALNDIVVTGKSAMQIINFSVSVNGKLLNRYYADGIIIATPTGSTGYNLSAGGPIISPKAEMILMTPICPHTFRSRSIVLSAEDVVTVEINGGRDENPQEVEVVFDGSHKMLLTTGERITIKKSEKTTAFIKLNQVSFLDVLHRKMSD